MKWNPAGHCLEKQYKVTDRAEKQRKGRGASTLSRLPQSQCSRAITTNDDWIAVAGNDGKVSIRAKSDPDTEVKLLDESDEWIECMAFSPDNTMLGVGSHDNLVRIYNVDGGSFSLKGNCKGHSSFIVAFDWCLQSKYIRSNCGAHEILYFTAEDC
jgi:WD40 repeat protein